MKVDFELTKHFCFCLAETVRSLVVSNLADGLDQNDDETIKMFSDVDELVEIWNKKICQFSDLACDGDYYPLITFVPDRPISKFDWNPCMYVMNLNKILEQDPSAVSGALKVFLARMSDINLGIGRFCPCSRDISWDARYSYCVKQLFRDEIWFTLIYDDYDHFEKRVDSGIVSYRCIMDILDFEDEETEPVLERIKGFSHWYSGNSWAMVTQNIFGYIMALHNYFAMLQLCFYTEPAWKTPLRGFIREFSTREVFNALKENAEMDHDFIIRDEGHDIAIGVRDGHLSIENNEEIPYLESVDLVVYYFDREKWVGADLLYSFYQFFTMWCFDNREPTYFNCTDEVYDMIRSGVIRKLGDLRRDYFHAADALFGNAREFIVSNKLNVRHSFALSYSVMNEEYEEHNVTYGGEIEEAIICQVVRQIYDIDKDIFSDSPDFYEFKYKCRPKYGINLPEGDGIDATFVLLRKALVDKE